MNMPFTSNNSHLFVAGFARGYRAWIVQPTFDFSLHSVSYEYSWLPGKNLAECQTIKHWQQRMNPDVCCEACAKNAKEEMPRFEGHRTPSINSPACRSCGFYALHDADFTGSIGVYVPDMKGKLAYGSIKAQGNVVFGEKGFRAQIAEVEALAGPVAKASAAFYNVPWYPNLKALTVDYLPQQQTAYGDSVVGTGPVGGVKSVLPQCISDEA